MKAKFVKVTQTADGADLPPWMIQRFSLYDVGGSRSYLAALKPATAEAAR